MALTEDGLSRRDRKVFELCLLRELPVATVMAGGYAPEVEDIVAIHRETVLQASKLQKLWVDRRTLAGVRS